MGIQGQLRRVPQEVATEIRQLNADRLGWRQSPWNPWYPCCWCCWCSWCCRRWCRQRGRHRHRHRQRRCRQRGHRHRRGRRHQKGRRRRRKRRRALLHNAAFKGKGSTITANIASG
jgi:hypothetical protein